MKEEQGSISWEDLKKGDCDYMVHDTVLKLESLKEKGKIKPGNDTEMGKWSYFSLFSH